MTDEEQDATTLGALIGRRLADAKKSSARPAIAIRLLVDAVVAQHPGVKLPELANDTEVSEWLEERSLGKGHLRQALTDARRALRKTNIDENVKRPPRRKAKAAETKSRSTDLFASAVPNRPIADL